MSGWVTVTGPPASIWALNFGTTEPFDASTLPKRTAISRMVGLPPARAMKSASSAWQYISASRLVAPSTETGSIALSVEIITIADVRDAPVDFGRSVLRRQRLQHGV